MDALHKKTGSPFMVILAFATVYIVWGSTYFFIQKAMSGFPPFLLGAMRFLIAGILMLGWTRLKGEQVFVKIDIKHAAVSGLLMLFIGTGAVIWVEQYLPSAMVAIMISSGPVWFILLDKPKWAENFRSKATIGGLIVGFAGILLLFGENIVSAFATGGNQQVLGGVAILIIGSMAWAGGSLYSKYYSTSGSVSVNIAWQMLVAGIAFIPGSILTGELQLLDWNTIPMDAWLSLFYLIVFGSIAGFSAYVWLLQVRSATQVSTHAYVNPVVAVLLGVFLANEHISLLQVLGLLTILASVLIINLVKYRKGRMAVQKENIAAQPTLSPTTPKIVQQITLQPFGEVKS
ncbi:MAG: EamA family transporter [Ferruginibacter sp.]|nr:EamA family transporter [Ferruginibacter sp.]